jgi:hypothetical protein
VPQQGGPTQQLEAWHDGDVSADELVLAQVRTQLLRTTRVMCLHSSAVMRECSIARVCLRRESAP